MHGHQGEILLLEHHQIRLRIGQEYVRGGGEKQDPDERAQTPSFLADGREVNHDRYTRERRSQQDYRRHKVPSAAPETLYSDHETITLDVIPEPATIGLLGVAAGALMFIRRRLV